MPMYDFRCDECGEEFESYSSVKERRGVTCECGGPTKIVLKISQKPVVFREGFFEHITEKPQYFSSKRKLLDACKREGVQSPFYG